MEPTGPRNTEQPQATRYNRARIRLVRDMERDGVIRTKALARAFRHVPREAFVPHAAPEDVYTDTTIPVTSAAGEWLTTSSQPAMMAIMLEQLGLPAGCRVLEIGAGTGYNAALLSEIAGPAGAVDTVEVEAEAAEWASKALAAFGSSARVHHADGADGWPDAAPYDRILSTVAVWDIPRAWEEQAKPDGRIIAPLTILGGEYSTALVRDGGGWASRSIEPCAFVKFKGRLSHPEARLMVGGVEESHLIIAAEPGELPPAASVEAWLSEGCGETVEGFERRGGWDGFVLWVLAHHGPERLIRGISDGRGVGWRGPALGLWDEGGMALVSATGRLERFGAGEAAATMSERLDAWRTAGAPDMTAFRILLTTGTEPAGPGRLPRWAHTVRISAQHRG